MDITNICRNYFHIFEDLSHWRTNTAKKNALASLTLLAYFTILSPITFALGATYGICSLAGRVKKKQNTHSDSISAQFNRSFRPLTNNVDNTNRLILITEANKYLNQAFNSFKLAAEKGHTEAQFYFGLLIKLYADQLPEDQQQNYGKAHVWIDKAAKNGHKGAEFYMKNGYYIKDNEASIQPTENAESIEEYINVKKHLEQAFKYYQLAAGQEHKEALFYLGYLYANGLLGIDQDNKKALQYYQKAAEKGHECANYHLGNIYYFGQGVEKNGKQAFQYYLKAAEAEHPYAQIAVGNAYLVGDGVEQNKEKSYKWTEAAANQGCADAQFFLGCIFEDKIDDQLENLALTVSYYKQAADNHHPGAQYKLGDLYKKSDSFLNHKERAKAYYQMAADNGIEEAKTEIESLEEI